MKQYKLCLNFGEFRRNQQTQITKVVTRINVYSGTFLSTSLKEAEQPKITDVKDNVQH